MIHVNACAKNLWYICTLYMQDAMDALSPEWKREMELRSLRSSKKVSNRNQIRDQPESAHKIWGGLQAERERASSYPLSSSPLKRDDLDDGVLSCTEAAEERDQGTKRNSVHNFPGNGSERKASLVELRHQALSTNGGTLGNQSRSSKRIQPEGHRSKQQVTKMSGTMSILATRNISGTQFNLQEPFVIAEVDGRRISSHVLVPKDSRGGAKIGEQESRQFVFSATEASVIRLSVCGWMSHSRAGQMEMESAIKGIVIIAVADVGAMCSKAHAHDYALCMCAPSIVLAVFLVLARLSSTSNLSCAIPAPCPLPLSLFSLRFSPLI
jgi:hypothetical protein